MRPRTVLSAVAAAFAALGLAGCSVPGTGVTGLVVHEGSVHAIVRTCAGVTANEVHMIPAEGQFFLIPHPTWSFEDSSDVAADLGSLKDFLALVGDKQQGFQSTVSDGVGGYIRFDSTDLEGLDEGMILASTRTRADNTVVDAEGFEQLLASVCENPY